MLIDLRPRGDTLPSALTVADCEVVDYLTVTFRESLAYNSCCVAHQFCLDDFPRSAGGSTTGVVGHDISMLTTIPTFTS